MRHSFPPDPTNHWRDRVGVVFPEAVQAGLNLLILVIWIALYRPVYPYLAVLFSREEFRTNQILLVIVAGLIGRQVFTAFKQGEGLTFNPAASPRRNLPALALVLVCSLLYLANERFLDINTLSATLFGLGTYGLLGLWFSPKRWREGLPAALLLVGVLPFGEHLQTFAGYPLRILTAGLVQKGLAAAGIHSLGGLDTILMFENGVSQVDSPCSGVKSLWTGGLFLLAATWIERRPVNLRWLWVALVYALLLFSANFVRVFILTAVGAVAGWRLLAEMLHVPLGVLGFTGACLAALALLRTGKGSPADAGENLEAAQARPAWLAPLIAGALLLMLVAYMPRPQPALASTGPQAWEFPDRLAVEPLPLSAQEYNWIASGGIESVERLRFRWGELSGSMILISSTTWRGQHRPERCFQVYGLEVKDSSTILIAPDFPVRSLVLSFDGSRSESSTLSAAYWLQSKERLTDDFADRIWSDLSPERQRWVLVTILFDRRLSSPEPGLQDFYQALRSTIAIELSRDEVSHPLDR